MHLRITVRLMLLTCGSLKVRDGRSRTADVLLPFTENGDRSGRTSVDLPPVIGELTLNDRGKAVSIVRRNY